VPIFIGRGAPFATIQNKTADANYSFDVKVLHRGSSLHRFNVDGGDPLEQLNCTVLEAIGRRSLGV
jgi:hypothetical protein